MKNASKKKAVAAKTEPPLVRTCGAVQVHHRLLENNPNFRIRLASLEDSTKRRLAGGIAGRTGLVTIPVVVQVVYNTAAENISDAQVKSQIVALNRDYSAGNADTTGFANTFIGKNAGLQTTTGSQNVMLGTNAGYAVTTGSSNILIGDAEGG